MTFISGGPGDSSGQKLGEVTQGIGFEQLPVNEEGVETLSLTATDDAGNGSVEDDVNNTDFTSQTGTTFASLAVNEFVSIVHKAVLYSYTGPKPVDIGVGGDYVTLATDYVAQGTADHDLLVNRTATDSHPTSAITGLDADQATQDQNLVDHETDPGDPHPQYALETSALATFTSAGYGGVGVDAPIGMANITASFQTLTGFDIALLSNPKGITQDFPNDGLRFAVQGVWQVSVKVSLTFIEENAGRQIQLRVWNGTDGTPSAVTFNYFVGRNQAGANLAFTLNFDYPAPDVGDLIQLQVASSSDTFTGVTNIGTVFQANHVSEAQFL